MKIVLFTSNQPRHLSLIKSLAAISEEVIVFCEVTTISPGTTDDFYKKSQLMQKYFERVIRAEKEVFGHASPLPKNVRMFPMKMGDLNYINFAEIKNELESYDHFIVFGASWIKGELCDYLVSKKAI